MTNILVEGCDGAGKTSMIEALLKLNTRYKYMHLEAPTGYDDARRMYVEMLDMLWTHDNLIYDRAHLSEMVYAPYKRHYAPNYMDALERLMPDNTILIVLDADLETLDARYDGKFILQSEIPMIAASYKAAFNASLMRVKRLYDSTNKTPYELAYDALHLAEYHEDPLERVED